MKELMVKSTDGKWFKLEKARMTENYYWRPLFMNRKEVKRLMKLPLDSDATVIGTGHYAFEAYEVTHALEATVTRHPNSLKIGCKRFTGVNYQRLRRWALRKA